MTGLGIGDPTAGLYIRSPLAGTLLGSSGLGPSLHMVDGLTAGLAPILAENLDAGEHDPPSS